PGRALGAAAAGAWVGEGGAAPVRALTLTNAAILRPRKLEVLSIVTREMVESSNIEAVVRQTLGEATGLSLDLAMFSNFAGDGTRPPGLFQSAALTPTAGGGVNAMFTDIKALFGALAAAGGGKSTVVIAALPQSATLTLEVGPQVDFPNLAH